MCNNRLINITKLCQILLFYPFSYSYASPDGESSRISEIFFLFLLFFLLMMFVSVVLMSWCCVLAKICFSICFIHFSLGLQITPHGRVPCSTKRTLSARSKSSADLPEIPIAATNFVCIQTATKQYMFWWSGKV